MSDAPERIWAWRKTEHISQYHVRMAQNWIGGQIPEPKHDGTDFLAGYIRADLCADPALLADAVDVLGTADDALTEAEAILGGEYGDHYGPLCETMLKLRRQIETLRTKLENRHE